MAEVVKVQVQAETKSAEDALRKAQQLADSLGKKQTTIRIKAEGIDGLAKQIRVVENETAKLALSADTFRALKSGAITATQAMEDMGAKVNRVNTDMQSFIDHATGVSRETSQITAKTSMFGKVSDDTFKSYTSGAMSGADATQTLQKGMSGLGNETQKTAGIFDGLTKRFTAANLISAAVTRGITLLRNALREAVTEMKEMDKELTTIKMVTGASASDINKLREQAFAGAKETGRATSDYLSAAERFARAGYRENIQDLTRLSLVTQNVGGVTEEVASKFLLAADAAWKMGGDTERLWSMLDGVTSIADQNATDIGKIAEAYTVAGSAFANAGESERTFAALIGATTAATQRSGSEMARGLQTILFRVRQVKGELDDGEIINAEDISNAAKALNDVAKINVLDEKTKELKSFSDIMTELAEKWDTLGSKEKAYLQNALAGNRRGNILFTLMDHWQDYEDMLEQFDESSGTALEKNAEYTDSWAAKTNELNTAWTELVSTLTGSGGIMVALVELASKLVEKINQVAKPIAKVGKYIADNKDKLKEFTKDIFNSEYDVEFVTTYGQALRFIGKAIDWMIPDDYDEATNAQDSFLKSSNKAAKAALENTKVYADEAEAVDELSTAFKNASENIKKAAENMKAEKDDSIKSAADIYKAMKEAADKGYYGSNAYKEGAKLFFGTSDKSAIGKIAQDALDTYFDAIAKGDYSNAAATLWGNFADESGKIVDKTTGEVIASMTDLGDAYRWVFNKGEQSMDDFLSSLQSSTGIGKDFWASMIQSLGMYSEEMDQWMEDNKELPEPALNVKTDSAKTEVQSAVDEINRMLDGIQDKEVRINIVQTISGMSTEAAMRAAADAYHNNRSYAWSGYGKAGGKHDNYSGIALVNDEFPADGSKPELIISKSQGRAYIANGGKPALVNLRSDDVVLTAKETESAMGGIPTFEDGTADPWSWLGGAMREVAKKVADALDGTQVTTPKDKEGGGGKNKGKKKPDADKTWAELKKLIEYLLDKAEGDLKDQLKVLDDMLEEMENSRKAEQEAKKLEELQTAAQEALVDLQRAQTERTVRYYNEETQQWEWMADQGSVEKAQEAYNNALDKLKEYEDDLAYEAKKAEIEAQKDALQEQYNLMKDGWDDIVDAIEAPSGDIEKLLNTLIQYGTPTMQEQSGGIADLLNKLRDGLFGAGYELGLGNINANTKNSGTTSSTVFDDGGFAYGSGMMRKGSGTETVIGPGITRAILNPVKNERFSSFVDSLRYLVDGGNGSFSFGNRSSITNNNGGNYYVNGVRVGSDMAQRPFAEVMKTIAIHANESL